MVTHDRQPDDHRDPLRDRRPSGDPAWTEVEDRDEPHVQDDVHPVEDYLQREEGSRPARSDEPAVDRVSHERRRGSPDPAVEVAVRPGFDEWVGLEETERDASQDREEEDEARPEDEAEHGRSSENGPALDGVFGAFSLGRQPGRRHPQEPERPVDEVECDGRDRDSRQIHGRPEPAHDGRVGHPGRGRRDLSEDDRPREPKDAGSGQASASVHDAKGMALGVPGWRRAATMAR